MLFAPPAECIFTTMNALFLCSNNFILAFEKRHSDSDHAAKNRQCWQSNSKTLTQIQVSFQVGFVWTDANFLIFTSKWNQTETFSFGFETSLAEPNEFQQETPAN